MRNMFRKPLLPSAVFIAAAAGASFAAAQVVGCSSPATPATSGSAAPSSANDPGASAGDTGSVGMQLTIPSGGEIINSVNWTITGPNGASTVVQSGTVMVGNSQTISFLVGGIPAGSNYSVSLSGQSADGSVTCAGMSSFSTTARTTTNVSVALQCTTATADAGSALVNGTTFNCASWNSATATPAETIVGTSVSLAASGTGPNTAGITYAWSVVGGTGSGSFGADAASTSSSQTPTFTCTMPGTVTLGLTVGDGPVPDGGTCNPTLSTTTVQITCDGHLDPAQALVTATPIKHLIVIFGENVSFDHYFGTYPTAQNTGAAGETNFIPAVGTPAVNGLTNPLDPTHSFAPTGVNLLGANPTNANPLNPPSCNPFRLPAAAAATKDMGHNYTPEQQASDNGAMDLFPKYTGSAGPPPQADTGAPAEAETTCQVMAYFDGNTLSTLWNLAQNFALNDNSWTTTFGPSTTGAINLIAGQTNGFAQTNHMAPDSGTFSSSHAIPDGFGNWTLIGDVDPLFDTCSSAADQVQMQGKNIGDLMNAANPPITWGWFAGGFSPSHVGANGLAGCNASTPPTVSGYYETDPDYIPHHMPFQYYASTANPNHLAPTGTIGTSDQANHQYDLTEFNAALAAGTLPAVVYLKALAYQDAHPGYSDPVDEASFVAQVVTTMQATQEWATSAIVIAYDDSDGWYDHQAPPIVNSSSSMAADALNATGVCNRGAQQTGDGGAAPATPLLGAPPVDGGAAQAVPGRCGYGTRTPMLVISPWAKRNFVDHTLVDQTSILRFVEDNWLGGQRIQAGGSFDTIANPITNMIQ